MIVYRADFASFGLHSRLGYCTSQFENDALRGPAPTSSNSALASTIPGISGA